VSLLRIAITDRELRSKTIDPDHLARARRALEEQGMVVLGGVVSVAHLEMLRERMMQDLEHILARPDRPDNFRPGNVQQDPPPFPPYLFEDVLANPIVAAISHDLLGPKAHNDFYSGNTNLPGSQEQPVHVDEGQLWPNLETAHPCSGILVQVCLVETSEHNGAIELWPGTHRETLMHRQSKSLQIPPERIEARRAIAPPVRGSTRLGDILLRDARLWHRGTSNYSDAPRHMLAMMHRPSWFRPTAVEFRRDAEEFLAALPLKTTAVFKDEVDYLHHWRPYELVDDSRPKANVVVSGAELYPHEV
jgi:hypothetical protein